MKKVILILAVLALLPVAHSNAANISPVVGDTLSFTKGIGSTSGGEFLLNDLTEGKIDWFGTFCVERNYPLLEPSWQYTVVNTGTTVLPDGHPLSNQVAWLYDQYRAGAITASTAWYDGLQNALWYYQGYSSVSSAEFLSLTTAADAAVLGGWTNHDVEVLNLVFAEDITSLGIKQGDPAQGLLAPVPEPGSMLLLGTGLFGLAGAVRRRMKK